MENDKLENEIKDLLRKQEERRLDNISFKDFEFFNREGFDVFVFPLIVAISFVFFLNWFGYPSFYMSEPIGINELIGWYIFFWCLNFIFFLRPLPIMGDFK